MTLELRVNGERFDGFEAGSVQLTMEECANSFDASYVADGRVPTARAIFAGDECEVLLDGDSVILGYVDTVDDEDEAELIRMRATGRSRAGDLVDCAAVRHPGSWSGVTIDRIVGDLVKDFGIASFVQGKPGAPLPHFAIQKGETAYDTIARAALKRGFYVYSVGGDLVLARAGSIRTKTVLERGVNLIRSARSDTWYTRFSDYIFRGQAQASDAVWGKRASQLKHKIVDPTITRFRPTYVTVEAHDGLDLQTRAILEMNQRAGRGERVQCLVDGWLTDEGKAWRPNTLVRFINPVLGVDADLLVATARFRLGASEAKQTELELANPAAYDLAANYPKRGRGAKWT